MDLEAHFKQRQGCFLEIGPEGPEGGVRIEVNWGEYGFCVESPYHKITKTFIDLIEKYHSADNTEES